MQKTYKTKFDGVTVEVVVSDAIAYTDPDVIGNLYAYVDNQEIFSKEWAYTISGFHPINKSGEELTEKDCNTDEFINQFIQQLWSYIDNDLSDNGSGWDYIFQLYYQQIMEAKTNYQE